MAMKIKKIACNNHQSKTSANVTCFVKPINRTTSVASLTYNQVKHIENTLVASKQIFEKLSFNLFSFIFLKIEVTSYFKFITTYRKMYSGGGDICKFYNGESNIYLQTMVPLFEKYFVNFLLH